MTYTCNVPVSSPSNARDFPSGAHVGQPWLPLPLVTARSPVPSLLLTYTCADVVYLRNASCLPSGDHAGSPSPPEVNATPTEIPLKPELNTFIRATPFSSS